MTVNKDKYDVPIEVGDTVVFTTSKGGGLTVGVIDKLGESGYMTIRYLRERNQLAYETGAPPIMKTSRRPKRDGDNQYIYRDTGVKDWRGYPRREMLYEDYEYEAKDYTPTGKTIQFWGKSVIWTGTNVIVLRKHDWSPRAKFTELMSLDYTKTEEELNG